MLITKDVIEYMLFGIRLAVIIYELFDKLDPVLINV